MDVRAALRYLADCGQEELGSVPKSLLIEAADEIDRFERHVEDLQAELDAKYQAGVDPCKT